MCDICKAEDLDATFRNGLKRTSIPNNLYKVFKNSVAPLKLCHIHNIELFRIGEIRFLKEHLKYARLIANRAQSASTSKNAFGF